MLLSLGQQTIDMQFILQLPSRYCYSEKRTRMDFFLSVTVDVNWVPQSGPNHYAREPHITPEIVAYISLNFCASKNI